MSGSIAGFLRARLDEDEATARAFLDWREAPRGGLSLRWDQVHSDQRAVGWGLTAVAAGVTPQVAAHIARWDPARVLAEVAAKRAIVALHTQTECVNCADAGRGAGTSCRTCHHDGESGGPTHYDSTCSTVLALAQPYAAHHDFDDAWSAD